MVGAPGFEPGTSRTPSVRATRLRYAPTELAPRGLRLQVTDITVSLGFEQRQETAEGIAQVEQHLAVQLRGFGFNGGRRC
jgi:hypothetical protein